MRIARLGMGLVLALSLLFSTAEAKSHKITVTGKLGRVMAMGGESTGWAIQFESETAMEGKQVSSVEVEYHKIKKLERLENKVVSATGVVSHRQGVEMGDRLVLVVSSMTESNPGAPPVSAPVATLRLPGSEWRLEDLGGSGVIDNIQAILAFPEAGKVAGNGSCNRFFGSAEISGNNINLGPLASSRMACPEAVMNQETKYLAALQAAERFEWKDPYLLIYCKGFEKPLRFARTSPPKATASQ